MTVAFMEMLRVLTVAPLWHLVGCSEWVERRHKEAGKYSFCDLFLLWWPWWNKLCVFDLWSQSQHYPYSYFPTLPAHLQHTFVLNTNTHKKKYLYFVLTLTLVAQTISLICETKLFTSCSPFYVKLIRKPAKFAKAVLQKYYTCSVLSLLASICEVDVLTGLSVEESYQNCWMQPPA